MLTCVYQATGEVFCGHPPRWRRANDRVLLREAFAEGPKNVLRMKEELGIQKQLTVQTCTKTLGLSFRYQDDGNLVLRANEVALWESGTRSKEPGRAVLQDDGNFVLYDAKNAPYWSTETAGKGRAGAYSLTLAATGNVYLRDYAGYTLWKLEMDKRVLEMQSVLRMDEIIPVDGELRALTPYWMRLHYQGDGNLVLYATPTRAMGEKAVWSTSTAGKSPKEVAMQGDGNLVVRDASGAAVWSSGTQGKGQPPYLLALQQDGNLVIYDGKGDALWATGTHVVIKDMTEQGNEAVLRADKALQVGESVRASAPHWPRLVLESDGNLRLYARPDNAPEERVVWETRTQGRQPMRALMQGDNNLVLYDTAGHAYWATETSNRGASPATLVVQKDGNVVIYDVNKAVLWTTGTDEVVKKLATMRNETLLPMNRRLGVAESVRATGVNSIQLVYENNGNLRLYGRPAGTAENRILWETDTRREQPGYMVLQGDGNLVLVNAAGVPYWASGTQNRGRSPYSLAVQQDGNLVLYDGVLSPLWSSETVPVFQAQSKLALDATLAILPMHDIRGAGWVLSGNNGMLLAYDAGNLKLFGRPGGTPGLNAPAHLATDRVLWESSTARDSGYVNLQGDGNLVLVDIAGETYWASGTQNKGRKPYNLVLQQDGNLVLYDGLLTPLWSTGTATVLQTLTRLASDPSIATLPMYAQLFPLQALYAGGRNNVFLVYEGNGRLRLRGMPGGKTKTSLLLWETETNRNPGYVYLRGDGNLVLVDSDGQQYWESGTQNRGRFPYTLAVQNDGNLVLYDGIMTPLWSTDTAGVVQAQINSTLDAAFVQSDRRIVPGQVIRANGPNYMSLVLEGNGNLRIYSRPGGASKEVVLWESDTFRNPGYMILESDGNLVLYDSGGQLYWSTLTRKKGRMPYTLALQSDGNLVLYDGLMTPLWSTDTAAVVQAQINLALDTASAILPMYQNLWPGEEISAGWPHWLRLHYQWDGNLVLFARPHNTSEEQIIWNSGTSGQAPGWVRMEKDGNLVIQDYTGKTYWATGTEPYKAPRGWCGNRSAGAGRKPYTLVLQGDGNMVVKDGVGTARWSINSGATQC